MLSAGDRLQGNLFDYLLKAVSGWQQVLTLVYPPYSLVDSIKLSYVIGL